MELKEKIISITVILVVWGIFLAPFLYLYMSYHSEEAGLLCIGWTSAVIVGTITSMGSAIVGSQIKD